MSERIVAIPVSIKEYGLYGSEFFLHYQCSGIQDRWILIGDGEEMGVFSDYESARSSLPEIVKKYASSQKKAA